MIVFHLNEDNIETKKQRLAEVIKHYIDDRKQHYFIIMPTGVLVQPTPRGNNLQRFLFRLNTRFWQSLNLLKKPCLKSGRLLCDETRCLSSAAEVHFALLACFRKSYRFSPVS